MHCPSCGKPATKAQQFCRNCGLSLETVSKIVTAHSEPSAANAQRIEKAQTEQRINRRMFGGLTGACLIFGIGIVLLVTDTSYLGKWIEMVFDFVVIAAIGSALYGVWPSLRFGAGSSRSRTPETVAQTEPNKSLAEERIPIPVPSVTERTTQLISPQDVSKSDE